MTTTPTHANDNRPQWFDALLAKYEPFIRHQCAKRAFNQQDDLYQDSVLRAIERWHQYREGPESGFLVWMSYIIRSVVRDRLRKNAPHITFEDVPPECVTRPAQEHVVEVKQTLRWCNPVEMEAIVLAAEGYDGNEIGASLGITRAAVSLRLRGGRAKLKRAANDNKRVRVKGMAVNGNA